MSFTHLHVHTEYSLLDGMSRISELPEYAKSLGMKALAITDHGAMFGAVDFYKACKKAGIKPIIGCEVYTAARTMHDKDSDKDRRMGHLILLAENQIGYNNIIKVVSQGYVDGFYFKPRIDKNLLREHSEGVICLSGCLAGNVQRELLNNNYDAAKREAIELRDIYGENNFFLEIQNHYLEEDKVVIEGLKRLSKDLGIPLVATNDAHYIRKSDAKEHDILLCIQTGTNVDDPNRMRFGNDSFYLKSEEEMRELFADCPEACDMTEVIAERCNFDFVFGEYHLPEYQPPEGYTCKEYMRKLCYEGLERRYGKEALDESNDLRKRLEEEISVIEGMGFVEYFLIVWDFINYAKMNGIMVGPGRGSAAGSIVSYCLAITEIDPIKYNLIFERFLNPERVSMPDIDIDFCIERRGEVIDYVKEKYGVENVSQIITFGTLKAKAVVRDVARVLNASYAEGDAIAKAIPKKLGITIADALEDNHELMERYETEPLVKSVIDISRKLEGLPRHASTHAAGVVISKKPIDEYVPLYWSDKGTATQFNMTTIEELGLLKMDFLGLRNLTVIRDACRLIKENRGVEVDLDSLTYDDPAVFEMISEGNTLGVFQLESSSMTSFMTKLKPSSLEDIIAGISLYRPGPMDSIDTYIDNKENPDKVEYVDPKLEPILGVTYGCLVYQEQVMQIVRELAGYSYGRSDLVRRAMSKKKMSVMLEEKEYFINGKIAEDGSVEIPGCKANGVSEEAAEAIFDDMVSFAQYAFNKSHAAAYSAVTYQTAYLKKYYPVEFMAALLISVSGQEKKTAKYIRNCRNMGIEILPPSVLKSGKFFTVEGNKIRYGLQSIKYVGSKIVDSIVEGRDENNLPHDLYEFINSINPKELNKKSIESLIMAGAMDELNENRAALLAGCEEAVRNAQRQAKKIGSSQMSFFQLDEMEDSLGDVMATPELPKVANFEDDKLLELEKQMLGVYVTGHPLNKYKDLIEANVTAVTSDLVIDYDADFDEDVDEDEVIAVERKFNDGDYVVLAGMLVGVDSIMTKKGDEMARIQLEDFEGTVDAVVFPRTFAKYKHLLKPDGIVAIRGRVSYRSELIAEVHIDSVSEIANIASIVQQRDRMRARKQAEQPARDAGVMPKESQLANPSAAANPNALPCVKLRVSQEVYMEHGDMQGVLYHIEDILSLSPGDMDVRVYLPDGKVVMARKTHRVKATDELRERLVRFLGSDNVKM